MRDAAKTFSPTWTERTRNVNLPLLAFVAASSLYMLMMSSGVLWMDVGELSAAAFNLGGAHPPGHPAHSLLGKLSTLIPIGEAATRIAMLSALTAGAALAGSVKLVQQFFPKHGLLGIGTALLIACTPALTLNATRPEVYAPTFALLSWSLVYFVSFLRSKNPNASDLLIGVFLMALSACFHPAIALSLALPMLASLLLRAGKRSFRLAVPALALCLLAALLYLYLPVRALAPAPPAFVWGNPNSWDNFLDLVTASVYQDNFGSGSLTQRIAYNVHLLTEGPAMPLFFVGISGLFFGWLTKLRGCGTLLTIVLCVLIASSLQSSFNPDIRAYLGIAFFCLAIGVSVVAMAIARMIAPSLVREDDPQSSLTSRTQVISLVTVLPVLLMAFLATPSDAMQRDKSSDAMRLWDETIALMPPGPGLFFSSGDHLLFVAQYEELVAGARPDIAIANPELVRDLWFLEHLRSRLPQLHMPFLDDGKKGKIAERLYWENTKRGYPVWGDALVPTPKFAAARGRAFAFITEPEGKPDSEPVPSPLRFSGYVGRKIAGLTALRRARFEASRGHLKAAVTALALEIRFMDTDLSTPVTQVSLLPYLPNLSPVFIYEEFQRDLVAADIAWQLGLESERGLGGGQELRIHAAWRKLLGDNFDQAYALLDSLGSAALATTPGMLVGVGQLALAEKFLRKRVANNDRDDSALALLASLLANQKTPQARREAILLFERALDVAPKNAETWSRLGLAYIQDSRPEDAERAWKQALMLEPGRRDVSMYLRKLESQRRP